MHPDQGNLMALWGKQKGKTNTLCGTKGSTARGGEVLSKKEKGRELSSERNNTFIKPSLLLTVSGICRETRQTLLSSEPISFISHIRDLWTQKKCQRMECSCKDLPAVTCSVVQSPRISCPSPPSSAYHISRPSSAKLAFPALF